MRIASSSVCTFLFLIGITFFSFPALGQTLVEDEDSAIDIVKSTLLKETTKAYRLYLFKDKIMSSQVDVKNWKRTETLTGGPGWLFFIDDSPKANWEHHCRYVLVSEAGELRVIEGTTPPQNMGQYKELTTWPSITSTRQLSASSVIQGSVRAATDAEHRYAVIISGGVNKYSNYSRYWNDCAFFYSTLKQYGFLAENITVLFADGTSSEVDRSDGEDSPTDFDGDGQADINYSATKANITTVFDELAVKLGSDDVLYIFTTDHGGNQDGNLYPYADPDVILYLWGDGEFITSDDFATEVNKVQAKAIVGIFEQCFSGGMVEKLKAENRVLMSASRWWELSYAKESDGDFDEFSFYVTEALSQSSKGDSNNDGIVTFEEAWLYALVHDSYQSETLDSAFDNNGEHPSYYSNPWDLGRKISLSGVDTQLKPPIYAGYTQVQSDEVYPTPGDAQGWKADDAVWNLSFPFAFPFGGKYYRTGTVSSNGVLFFGTSSLSNKNSVDSLSQFQAIAPLWDDLTTDCEDCDIFITSSPESLTIVWQGYIVVDTLYLNVALRLYPDGSFTTFYGEGNDQIARFPMRDKTIGLSTGHSAHFSLCNGASNLNMAASMTFQPVPTSIIIPWLFLLLE